MSDKGPWGRRSGGTRLYGLALAPVATGASNNVSSTTIDADEVMLHARTQACKVAIGPTPDATAYTFILEAGERFHVKLARNADKIAAIALTGTGSLEITPCK